MSAKSYTKVYFGGNILIRPICKNKDLYISSERVSYPFWEKISKYIAKGNVENILKQTLYEMVILHLTLSIATGGFLLKRRKKEEKERFSMTWENLSEATFCNAIMSDGTTPFPVKDYLLVGGRE